MKIEQENGMWTATTERNGKTYGVSGLTREGLEERLERYVAMAEADIDSIVANAKAELKALQEASAWG